MPSSSRMSCARASRRSGPDAVSPDATRRRQVRCPAAGLSRQRRRRVVLSESCPDLSRRLRHRGRLRVVLWLSVDPPSGPFRRSPGFVPAGRLRSARPAPDPHSSDHSHGYSRQARSCALHLPLVPAVRSSWVLVAGSFVRCSRCARRSFLRPLPSSSSARPFLRCLACTCRWFLQCACLGCSRQAACS